MNHKLFIPPALGPFKIIVFVLHATLLTTRRMLFGGLQGFCAKSGEVCLIAIFAASPVRAVVDRLFPPDRPEIGRVDARAGDGRSILSGI
jgi:hypothetical protein